MVKSSDACALFSSFFSDPLHEVALTIALFTITIALLIINVCPLPTLVVIFPLLLRLSGLQADRQMGLFFDLIINIIYAAVIKGRNVRNHHQNQRQC